MLILGDRTWYALRQPHRANSSAIILRLAAQRIDSGDVRPRTADRTDSASFREEIESLIAEAEALGISAWGDVVPYCLLMLHDRTAPPLFDLWPVIHACVSDVSLPAEMRLDAVYALLPPTFAGRIFPPEPN